MLRLFGEHPKGLLVVVLTGVWENFALFGMRTILVFYLVKDLHFSSTAAVQLYFLSTSAGFIATLVGGIIADRTLGIKNAVTIGALAMAVGHLILISPQMLYPGLGLITLGYGLFKPSTISQVTQLYALTDPRRDRALTLYKAGTNVGAIAAPFCCGAIGVLFGWSYGIALCGVGMSIAAAIWVAGRAYLVLHPQRMTEQITLDEEGKSQAIIPIRLALVLIGALCFWSSYYQIGGTVSLWLDSSVNRGLSLGPITFQYPAPWAQSVNPILVVILTPLVNSLWAREKNKSNSEVMRMLFGALMLAVAFMLLWLGIISTSKGSVPSWWLLAYIFLLSLAEIYFEPVGQAFALRFARPGMISTFASFWFMTQAGGLLLAGALAALWGVMRPDRYFAFMALIAAVTVGILGGTVVPKLVKKRV